MIFPTDKNNDQELWKWSDGHCLIQDMVTEIPDTWKFSQTKDQYLRAMLMKVGM